MPLIDERSCVANRLNELGLIAPLSWVPSASGMVVWGPNVVPSKVWTLNVESFQPVYSLPSTMKAPRRLCHADVPSETTSDDEAVPLADKVRVATRSRAAPVPLRLTPSDTTWPGS